MPQQFYESSITIGGSAQQATVPSFRWHVQLGSYGQLSTADVFTSVAALKAANIDLPFLSQNNYTPVSLTLNNQVVFGGNYMYGHYTFEQDEVHFICRDYAGILFDTKRSVAELNIQNQTVSQFVKQIVKTFGQGLTSVVDITNDPLVGTVLNNGAVAMTYPQSMWQLLVFLARMVGAQIYTTPQKVLNFVNVLTNPAQSVFTWRVSPQQANQFIGPATNTNQQFPMMNLMFTHQPARNQNFSVVVISHHQQTCVQSIATVTVAAQNITIANTSPIAAGYYTGAAGKQLKSVLSAQGNGIPVYVYTIDGLKPDAVQAQAQAIALDIARRLLIANLRADGNPMVRPLQQIQIGEAIQGDLLGFANQALYISGVDHTFDMPQDEESDENGGYWTTIKALTVPPVANPTDEITQGGGSGGGGGGGGDTPGGGGPIDELTLRRVITQPSKRIIEARHF